MESELELLPCPFCSETQIKLTEWPANVTVCEIFCLNCKINTGAKFTKEEAIKHWNSRKDPEKEALIEIIKDLLNIFPAEYAALTAAKGTIQEAEAALASIKE